MAEDKGNKGDGTKSAELLAIEKQAQSPEALAADQARLRAGIPDVMRGGVRRPFQESAKLIPGTFTGPIDAKTEELLDKVAKGTDQFTCPNCNSRREYSTYRFRANVNGEGVQDIELHRCSVCSVAFFDPKLFMAAKK